MSHVSDEIGSLQKITACTPGSSPLPANVRALIASEDMTADLTFDDDTDCDDVPLTKGMNAIKVKKVRAVSAGSVFLGF